MNVAENMEEQIIQGRYITHKSTVRDYLVNLYGADNFEVDWVDGGESIRLKVPRGRRLNAIQKKEIQERSQKAVQKEQEQEKKDNE